MPLSQIASWDINAVDVVVLRCARGALKHISFDFTHLDRPSKDGDLRAMLDQVPSQSPAPLKYNMLILRQFMLSLGDIHIGFAIAIIGYGFSSLSRGVTAYEWWIMVGLGWLAIVTNIAVTCFLRDFHRKYPVKRGWRICLIFAMVALLGVCMVPIVRIKQAMSHQSQQSRNDILLVNAMCFFPGRGHVFPSEGHAQLLSRLCILVGSLVVVGILTVAVTILERPGSILRKWCELYRGDVHESSTRDQLICARCEQRFVLLAMRPFVALWLTARTHLELLNSVLAEVSFAIIKSH